MSWNANHSSNAQMEQFLESFAREMKSEVFICPLITRPSQKNFPSIRINLSHFFEKMTPHPVLFAHSLFWTFFTFSQVNAARNEIKQAQTRHEAALAVVVDQCAALREEFEVTRHELSRQLREVSIKVESVSEQASNTDREVVELFKRLDTLLSFHRLDNIVKNPSNTSQGGGGGSSFNSSFAGGASNNTSRSGVSFLGGPVSMYSAPSPAKQQSAPISVFSRMETVEKKERPAFFGSASSGSNSNSSPPRRPLSPRSQPPPGSWRPPWHSKSPTK